MKRFDPKRLFEPYRRAKHGPRNHPYPTDRRELEGAESGRKPISRGSFLAGALTEYDLLEHVFLAFEHGLVVTLHGTRIPRRPFEQHPVTMFTSRAEDLWRVPALLTWSRGIGLAPLHPTQDRLESLLLGYTPAQIKRWHRFLGRVDDFYVYTLLTEDERARVIDLGYRCFGSTEDLVGKTFFMMSAGVLKADARRLVPKGLVLARTKSNAALIRALIGDPRKYRRRSSFINVRASEQQAFEINRAMRSNVELLTSRGWRGIERTARPRTSG